VDPRAGQEGYKNGDSNPTPNNSIQFNLFIFPSIHLQGLNHMDTEIVKNTSLTLKYSKIKYYT